MTIDKISPDLQLKVRRVVEILKSHTKRAYLVGGCVRDLMLNKEIKDLDIEVYDICPVEFDAIMEKSGASGVGKSFFVYKLDGIDLSLPRVERKVGIGHQAFEVKPVNDERLASKRRDFSMNAMMLNIFNGEFLDFWNGRRSIEVKEISLIDEISFKEDSLRVLRAIGFSARFGFKVEKKTFEIMKGIALDDLTKSRVFWEFEKIFKADNLYIGLSYMYELGIFEKIFGCKVDKKGLKELKYEFDTVSFEDNLREFYFIYIVANRFGFNPLAWLKRLEAPKSYLNVFKNQPYFYREISDKELLEVAIDLPISKWLGHFKIGVKSRAKKMNIWNQTFSGGVSFANIIADGFVKEEIKKEYKKRVLFKISRINL